MAQDEDMITEAWDCNPQALALGLVQEEPLDQDLNEEDDTGDWQVVVLDRFHDRLVRP